MTRFAQSLALPLVSLGALVATATPLAAAEIQMAVTGPVVEVTVTETVKADPDVANLSAGVSTLAPTAVEAMRLNAEAMNSVVDRIDGLGVAREDIQTTGINLNPEYVFEQETNSQKFVGYRAMNRVTVTLRAIDKTGEVLDALVTAGANDISGITWSIDDPKGPQEQARQAAFATARTRAEGYARLAGMRGVRLLEVNESTTGGPPIMYDMAPQAASARQSSPVRPGQVQTGVTITVKYEMTS
jgi:uncharacterized protein YggE